MTVDEAQHLIEPAIRSEGGVWADFGAGRGVFSRALARLIGPDGKVFAVDRDDNALAVLNASHRGPRQAPITPIRGDFLDLQAIDEFDGIHLDGVLFANSLHFTSDPARALRGVAARLDAGVVVVVEYDRSVSSPWVPFPIPPAQLAATAAQAGFANAVTAGRRSSAFGGSMYCMLLSRPEPDSF